MLRIVLAVAALARAAAWVGPAAGLAPHPRGRAVALAAQQQRLHLPVRRCARVRLKSDDAPGGRDGGARRGRGDPGGRVEAARDGRALVAEVWVQRLWTKRDFLHAHAISGTVFSPAASGGSSTCSRASAREQLNAAQACGGLLPLVLLLVGVINALTALPMASNYRVEVIRDMDRFHALAFKWGGSAQLALCAWLCWWFAPGAYPPVPHAVDTALSIAGATVIGYVVFFSEQSNAERRDKQRRRATRDARPLVPPPPPPPPTPPTPTPPPPPRAAAARRPPAAEAARRRAAAATAPPPGAAAVPAARAEPELSDADYQNLEWLARLGSYPNTLQLPVLLGVGAGGREWMDAATERFPMQPVLLHHYLFGGRRLATASRSSARRCATAASSRYSRTSPRSCSATCCRSSRSRSTELAFGGSLTFNPGDYPPGSAWKRAHQRDSATHSRDEAPVLDQLRRDETASVPQSATRPAFSPRSAAGGGHAVSGARPMAGSAGRDQIALLSQCQKKGLLSSCFGFFCGVSRREAT